MVDAAHRRELADFLRSRRGRTSPQELGLVPGPRRRTPGLRREEVAQLSGVSVTWYTWLEQARDISVSTQVLDALAQALRLTPAETRHLYALAGGRSVPGQEPAPPPAPDSALRRMLDALNPNPAYLIGPSWDLLAWNAAEAGLIGDPARLPECERNLIRMVFTDARTRALMADHRVQAADLLAHFRADAARGLGEPGFERLRGELYATSEEFRALWDEQRAAETSSARWVFNHPRLGRLTVDYVRLAALETPGVRLFACFPADPETEAKLPGLLDPQQAFETAAAA